MKIRKYACIAISAALLMTGCQATPDQDIVANKNDNQASQNETSQSVDDTIAIDENADGKVVSEAISDSFDSTEGDVTIKVQADQVRAKNVPVLQAEAQSVSADDVKRWCNVFFGTEDVYEYRDEMTKSDIEEAILWRQQKISDRDGLLAEGYTEDEIDSTVEFYQEQIDNLKSNYDSAPEKDGAGIGVLNLKADNRHQRGFLCPCVSCYGQTVRGAVMHAVTLRAVRQPVQPCPPRLASRWQVEKPSQGDMSCLINLSLRP